MEDSQNITLFSPLCTRQRFAEMTGLDKEGDDVVRGMIEKGHLPTVKVGKYRLINLALLNSQLLKEVWEK